GAQQVAGHGEQRNGGKAGQFAQPVELHRDQGQVVAGLPEAQQRHAGDQCEQGRAQQGQRQQQQPEQGHPASAGRSGGGGARAQSRKRSAIRPKPGGSTSMPAQPGMPPGRRLGISSSSTSR